MSAKRKRWDPTPDQIRQAVFLHGNDPGNFTIGKLAQFFDVSKATFELAIKKNEALRQGLSGARSKMLGKVVQTAYTMATSGEEPGMTQFYLKCQGQWSYKTETNVHHKGLLTEEGTKEHTAHADKVFEEFKGLLDEFKKLPIIKE